MIRGVAFDLEGTLVDVERAHHEGHLRAAADAGVHLTLEEAIDRLPHFIGGPDVEIAREIWCLSDRRSTVETILAATKQYYFDNVRDTEATLRPGAEDFLHVLRAAGYHVAIGSSTPAVQAAPILRASGLDRIVPPWHVVLAEDVEHLKPAPDVFRETAARMGIFPGEQVVFDDSVNGVRAACAAGSVAVGVPLHERTVEALRAAGATRVLLDWREVARPCLFLAEVAG